MSVLSQILPGRMIPFSVTLGRACGGITEAILVMQIAYWQDRKADPAQDGFVQLSDRQLTEELLMTPRQLRRLRAKLSSLEIIEHRRRGVPARTWYRLDYESLERILLGQKVTTRPDKRSPLAVTKGEVSSIKKIKNKNKNTPHNPPDAGFIAFWDAWPDGGRKYNDPKRQLIAKWQSMNLEDRAEEIVGKVNALKASRDWTKDNGAYIPAPMGWLSKERYEVDLETILNARNQLPKMVDGRREKPLTNVRTL